MKRLEYTFRVRGYELDRSNRLSLSNWLRYLEQLRWEHFLAERPAFDLLFSKKHQIVVVAQQLDAPMDIKLDTEIAASLWIGAVGNSSFTFNTQFTFLSGSTAARGTVTVVYIDPNGKPKSLPDSFRETFAPKSSSIEKATFLSLEAPSERAPESAWTSTIEVRPSDIDMLQHVNHAKYMDYFDDARELAIRAQGYGDCAPHLNQRIRQMVIEYRRQAVLGETLRVLTWVQDKPRGSLGFELQRSSDGEPLCRALARV